ncbi:MAG: M48 family metalloprotease [Myxococcales bacterium]|nr:M48 family metalloprotease [Myxococcales bacterium]
MSLLAEALVRSGLVLATAALVPIATARLLWLLLLRRAPPDDEGRARALAPFRTAAFIVGVAQLEVAWIAGYYALVPPLVPRPGGLFAGLFGGLVALVAFVAGGIGRRVEEPAGARSTVAGVAVLRLRMAAWFAGPLATAAAVRALPVVGEDGAVRWGWVAAAVALGTVGIAYGGLVTALATRALVPATAEVRRLARAVAELEGTSLALVLRLPTRGTHFANAAAIPWARTMVVTDGIVELLSQEELAAVMAHEAGHLSEPPSVMLARLGAAVTMVLALTTGTHVATAYGLDATLAAALGVALALGLLLAVRRLARRMEERADARARATVGAGPLALALLKLHAAARLPLVTGARRVHPDLYDRLRALGHDPGPRPVPPARRRGLAFGLALAAAVVAGGYAALASSTESAADAVNRGVEHSRAGRHAEAAAEYRRGVELDPGDAIAHYDLALALDRLGDAEGALAAARTAVRLEPDRRRCRLLARLAHTAGALEEADEAARRAASFPDDDPP